MCTKPIRYLLVALMSLGLSGVALEVNADDRGSCLSVPVTVVNSSGQDLTLIGADGPHVIKAKTTSQVVVQSQTFYTRCGLLEVGLNGQAFKRGLVDDQTKAVAIHVNPKGQFEQVGFNQAGLDLDQYVAWWGLRAVLG